MVLLGIRYFSDPSASQKLTLVNVVDQASVESVTTRDPVVIDTVQPSNLAKSDSVIVGEQLQKITPVSKSILAKMSTTAHHDLRSDDEESMRIFLSKPHSHSELVDFLKEHEQKEFHTLLENSKSIEVPDSQIQGCFRGSVLLDGVEQSAVTLIHYFSELGRSNVGRYWIGFKDPITEKLHKNSGVDYSRRLRYSDALKNQLLVEFWPEAAMQLFYWKYEDRYIGNFYKKTKAAYEVQGSIHLLRQKRCNELDE